MHVIICVTKETTQKQLVKLQKIKRNNMLSRHIYKTMILIIINVKKIISIDIFVWNLG